MCVSPYGMETAYSHVLCVLSPSEVGEFASHMALGLVWRHWLRLDEDLTLGQCSFEFVTYDCCGCGYRCTRSVSE